MRPNDMLNWQKLHRVESELQNQRLRVQAEQKPVFVKNSRPFLAKLKIWLADFVYRMQSPKAVSHTCRCEAVTNYQ